MNLLVKKSEDKCIVYAKTSPQKRNRLPGKTKQKEVAREEDKTRKQSLRQDQSVEEKEVARKKDNTRKKFLHQDQYVDEK